MSGGFRDIFTRLPRQSVCSQGPYTQKLSLCPECCFVFRPHLGSGCETQHVHSFNIFGAVENVLNVALAPPARFDQVLFVVGGSGLRAKGIGLRQRQWNIGPGSA